MASFSFLLSLLVSTLCLASVSGTANIVLEDWSVPYDISVTGNVAGVSAAVVFKDMVHIIHRAQTTGGAASPLYYSRSTATNGSDFGSFVTLPQPVRATSDPALAEFNGQLVLIYVNNGISKYATYDGVSSNPFSNSAQFQADGLVAGAVSAVAFNNHLIAIYPDANNHGMVTTCDSSLIWNTAYDNGQSWVPTADVTLFNATNSDGNPIVVEINSGNGNLLFWSYTTNPLDTTHTWVGASWHGQTTTGGSASVAPIVLGSGGCFTSLYAYFYVNSDNNALVYNLFDSAATGAPAWRGSQTSVVSSSSTFQVSAPAAVYYKPEKKIYLYYWNSVDNNLIIVDTLVE